MAMNRKDFLQKSLLGGLGIFMSRQALQAADNDELDFTQFAESADFQQVGFEHLPYNPNQTEMETALKPNMILQN